MLTLLRVALTFALLASLARAAPPALRSGDVALRWVGDDRAGWRPELAAQGAACAAGAAVHAHVLPDGDDATATLAALYATVEADGDALACAAKIETPGGTVLDMRDRWMPAEAGAFRVARVVTVARVGRDRAFGTELRWAAPSGAARLADADVFVPGLWYADADRTPPSGLVRDVGQRAFLLREDRMPLPLVSLRVKRDGWTITLRHSKPDGATVMADDTPKRLVDARLKFGALGLRREDDQLSVAFVYPGSEGEQTSLHGYKPDRRTAERLHPIEAGVEHRYELVVSLARAASFPDQLRAAWRAAWADAAPQAVPFDARATLDASIGVLGFYAYDEGAVSGIPFAVTLPGGEVRDRSLQMGFVGQQLPCASYLIDEGLHADRPELVAQGERICAFWARESMSAAGVPRTWYDVDPEPKWRAYDTYVRVATDGALGLLRAHELMRKAGRDRPEWLAFCRAVGDWLLKAQNRDGSWFRAYKFDTGQPAHRSTSATLHPVRLLVELTCATGDARYERAARRAAEFALRADQSGARYVGGTPDNPDVVDKEAAWLAFDGFLTLHDRTGEAKYLEAARRAADFAETWVYAWDVPPVLDGDRGGLPRLATRVGANVIATGHSGADVFLAYAALSYQRLALKTGDAHYADVARVLQHNLAAFVDTDGRHGYGARGLLVEAFSLAGNRGHSVKAWLPWGTSAVVDPMMQARAIYGVLSVEEIARMDPAEARRRDAAYARNRGYGGAPAAAAPRAAGPSPE